MDDASPGPARSTGLVADASCRGRWTPGLPRGGGALTAGQERPAGDEPLTYSVDSSLARPRRGRLSAAWTGLVRPAAPAPLRPQHGRDDVVVCDHARDVAFRVDDRKGCQVVVRHLQGHRGQVSVSVDRKSVV